MRNQFGAKSIYSRAYATWTLVALNVIGFILQGFPIGEPREYSQFTIDYASFNGFISHNHEYYRLLTGAFLHVALWHIAFNLLALAFVGPALESMLGRLRYVTLYLLAAIGGNVLGYLVKDDQYLAVGASGAIFGLFAAYWVLAKKIGADTSAMTGVIVLNLIITVTFPGIALYGHLGGLIVGGVVGAVYAYSGARRWHLQLAGVVLVAAVLVVATLLRTASITG